MAALRHPNVVMFMGLCLEPPCIVTEFCARGSLYDVLKKARGAPAFAQQLDWSRRLSMALDAAKVTALLIIVEISPLLRFYLCCAVLHCAVPCCAALLSSSCVEGRCFASNRPWMSLHMSNSCCHCLPCHVAHLKHAHIQAVLQLQSHVPHSETDPSILHSCRYTLLLGLAAAWLTKGLVALQGVLQLHSHKPPILHRDLKSPNMLVDRHWRVKVTDFNLSRMVKSGSNNASVTSLLANNPRWLAPEVRPYAYHPCMLLTSLTVCFSRTAGCARPPPPPCPHTA